jgi:hypothetical protein
MVTLWFEIPEDPWVIDPTGTMTLGMPRMSELSRWTPLRVFSDERDYSVRLRQSGSARPEQATAQPLNEPGQSIPTAEDRCGQCPPLELAPAGITASSSGCPIPTIGEKP